MRNPLRLIVAFAAFQACSSPPPAATITNFANPLPRLYTSGQPTESQFAALPAIGIKRVIHLRPTSEKGTGWEEQLAEEVGVEFVRLPIDGANGLTRSNVERLAAELQKNNDAGTLVSCASSNRVGAMLALKAAWLDGLDKDAAMTIGRAGGMTKLEPHVANMLK